MPYRTKKNSYLYLPLLCNEHSLIAVLFTFRSPKGQVRRPTRPEHVIAFEFLKIHYEEDVKAEIPVQKSDVYHDYELVVFFTKLLMS